MVNCSHYLAQSRLANKQDPPPHSAHTYLPFPLHFNPDLPPFSYITQKVSHSVTSSATGARTPSPLFCAEMYLLQLQALMATQFPSLAMISKNSQQSAWSLLAMIGPAPSFSEHKNFPPWVRIATFRLLLPLFLLRASSFSWSCLFQFQVLISSASKREFQSMSCSIGTSSEPSVAWV